MLSNQSKRYYAMDFRKNKHWEKVYQRTSSNPSLISTVEFYSWLLLLEVSFIDNRHYLTFRPTSSDVRLSNNVDWLLSCGVVVTLRLCSTVAPLPEILVTMHFLSDSSRF
jgi:hypothetical protein